jgi:hypothetical protein
LERHRLEAGQVFYAQDGGLIAPDTIVLTCYELAYFYHVDPQIFLEQTITQLGRHKHWTTLLSEKIRDRQEAESGSDQ